MWSLVGASQAQVTAAAGSSAPVLATGLTLASWLAKAHTALTGAPRFALTAGSSAPVVSADEPIALRGAHTLTRLAQEGIVARSAGATTAVVPALAPRT